MKIQIDTNYLQKILKAFKNVNVKSIEVETQRGLLIDVSDSIKLLTNNLEIQMESMIDGIIMESGNVILPESTVKLLEHFKDDYIVITDTAITHGSKELRYNNNLPVEDFSYFNEAVDKFLFETTEKELNRLLGVHYATTDLRDELEGINIRENMFIASDGFIGAIRYGSFNCNENVIISKPVWEALRKITNKRSDKPVKVYWDGKSIKFKFVDYELTGKLVDKKYFDILRVIPDDHKTKITLSADELIKSITLMEKLKEDKQRVDIKIDNVVTLETRTTDNVLIDTIPATVIGQPLEIRFDIKLFSKVIKQYKEEELIIEFNGSVGPGILKSDNKLEIIMPVRRDG